MTQGRRLADEQEQEIERLFQEGILSNEQISKIVGCSSSTVGSRRKKIHDELEREINEKFGHKMVYRGGGEW